MNMKELAAICGVSPATVSYALRNDSRISEAVRKQIQAKAQELNYRPDANSSALVRYRTQGSAPPKQPTVGIVYAHPHSSRRTQLIQPHIKSFRKTIDYYGYEVKEYFLDKDAHAMEALLRHLRKDEIQGLVLAWGQWGDRLKNFPWNEFSVVSAERNEIHPALDRVSVNHFNATDEVFRRLKSLGAQRVGLVCHNDVPIRVKKNIIGAYIQNTLSDQSLEPQIPPFFYRLNDQTQAFKKWFQENKLDAIISHRQIAPSFFEAMGLQFPRDAYYAVIEIDDEASRHESGIIMDDDLGQVLAETITGKLHYREKVELNRKGSLILVDGQWRDGEN